jgi:hypothetical protein
MGYSSRYHVASLAAVFIALAIGILIGAALGSDVVSGTAENLEEDLSEDLDSARAENADLREQVDFERGFAERIVPALVADRLNGRSVALIGLGNVDTGALNEDVESALSPSGAELSLVGTLREPPDGDGLVGAVLPRRQSGTAGERLELAAERIGDQLARGGELPGDVRSALFSSFSGTLEDLDAAVVVRSNPAGLNAREEVDVDLLERGVIHGMQAAGTRVVGAEVVDVDPSSIDFFDDLGLSTVDNVDQLPGRVALVLALEGADGNFGVKDTADNLLPDLIDPSTG